MIGGDKMVGLFTILLAGTLIDSKLAGKSKYEAPKHRKRANYCFSRIKHRKLLFKMRLPGLP